uniref:PR domain-containing protein 11-like n=1 Tax=Diabrotica virgifera virgifera TaxID=50390 RepID=A0A6P7FPX1_DIAVI
MALEHHEFVINKEQRILVESTTTNNPLSACAWACVLRENDRPITIESETKDCDTCKKDYVDFCSNCGALVVLEDTPLRMGVEMRAKKTAPKGILEVQTSKIHGLGVIALRSIQKGVRLGPYQGQITRVDSTTGYAWKLKDGRLVHNY